MRKIIQRNDVRVNGQGDGINKPPYGNTGVLDTKGLKSLIDWCDFTLPVSFGWEDIEVEEVEVMEGFPSRFSYPLQKVKELLGIPSGDWLQMPRGGRYYKSKLQCGHISIYYDGAAGMGIHVSMSGQGCREYEGRFGDVWEELLAKVFLAGGHFPRLDGAIDDFSGSFTVEQIEGKVKMRELKSLFKKSRGITDYDLSTEPGKGEGKTQYFGSSASDTQIRIYDKGAEQGVNYSWVRTELECRNEKADELARHIIAGNWLGRIISGVLKNYVNFLERSEDSNKGRWPVCSWWDKFLGDVEKLRLSVQKAVQTIKKKIEWLKKSVATSFALVNVHYDNKNRDFNEFVCELLEGGQERFKPHHMALLQAG